MLHANPFIFGIWCLFTLVAVFTMAYTARRVWKVNQTGRDVVMPLMFSVLVMMAVNDLVMVLWMMFGGTWLGVAACIAAFVHMATCGNQARRADEF